MANHDFESFPLCRAVEVEMDNLIQARQQYNERFGTKVGESL